MSTAILLLNFGEPQFFDRAAVVAYLEDLVTPFLADIDPAIYQFRQCQCRDTSETRCLNGL